MTNDEIITFWGTDELIRWQPEVVAATSLPEDSKRFLADVGLPRGIAWSITFGAEAGRLSEFAGRPGYYTVGGEYPWICLDASRNGCVVAVLSKSPSGATEFVNTNVRLFAAFLVLYQKFRQSVEGLGETDARELVYATKRQMESSDPPALTTPKAFWPSIIEEMYIGWM